MVEYLREVVVVRDSEIERIYAKLTRVSKYLQH